MFSIQAALATEIAGALKAAISPETKKLLERLPNNAEAIYGLATIQKRQGRWLESVANHRKALQLDPGMIIAVHGDLAGARLRLGNLPAEVRAKLELDPTNPNLWSEQALMAALLGQKTEALRDARKAVELLPESLDAWSGARHSRDLAVVYAWTGDKDRAIAELTRQLRVPSRDIGSVHDLRVDPAFAPLRGDPRFEALLKDPKNVAPLF